MENEKISNLFDMQTFSKESFSVDEFLTENRNKMSLENMRVEMGIFLKDLRNQMINSLNDDCDKYFHLSKGLIGIDQQLATLKPGLHAINYSIIIAKKNLEDTLRMLDSEIQLNKQLFDDKQAYYAIVKVQNSLEKLENLLNQNDCDTIALTRIVAEYNQLMSNMAKSNKIIKSIHLKKQSIINDLMMNHLNNMFVASLKTNSKAVKRFLELYLSLGRIKTAEDVCREKVIAPEMSTFLNENYLLNCKDGLKGLFKKCFEFLTFDLKHLLDAAAEKNLLSSKSCKFDFVLKSYWPVINDHLQNNLKSIYNYKEPNVFIENYKITFDDFMKNLIDLSVTQCESQSLCSTQTWDEFKKCWNLPIYYQYCFQEIGCTIENAMCNYSFELCKNNFFKLKVTETVWDCMYSCLDQNIFIIDLSPKFIKLILHIISRYQTWANDSIINSKKEIKEFSTRIKFLEYLEEDLKNFYFKLNDIYSMLQELLKIKISNNILEQLKSCITEVNLNSLINNVCKFKVQLVIDEAMSYVIRVTDVPRLFRHTNREYPTEPCSYMKSIVTTLKILQDKNCKKQVLEYVVIKYIAYIDDVMKAIKKTEESLRKLKKIRDPNYKVNLDDDKIRCQLSLDVNFLLLSIGSMLLPQVSEIELKLEKVKETIIANKS